MQSPSTSSGIGYPELLQPTLGDYGIVENNDWDELLGYCHVLFQTHQGLQDADYYTHLRSLDRIQGLQLATALFMRGRGGDITRMANNIMKLKQLQQLEAHYNTAAHHHLVKSKKRIEVLTLSLDDLSHSPKDTAMHFLNFLLPTNDGVEDSISQEKERIASEYAEGYTAIVEQGDHTHVTHTRRKDDDVLETSLREHHFFGRLLTNIEDVVNDALAMNE